MKEDRAFERTKYVIKGTDMKLRDPELLGLPKRGILLCLSLSAMAYKVMSWRIPYVDSYKADEKVKPKAL